MRFRLFVDCAHGESVRRERKSLNFMDYADFMFMNMIYGFFFKKTRRDRSTKSHPSRDYTPPPHGSSKPIDSSAARSMVGAEGAAAAGAEGAAAPRAVPRSSAGAPG